MSGFLENFKSMNQYEIHKALINTYLLRRPGDTILLKRDTSRDKRDVDVIRENHKFLWDDENPSSWEERLAKKYYDKLFKEFCICDLRLYKENKVALRWRVEQEVVTGKGQFICGDKYCKEQEGLRTWEVNFAYIEQNEKKNALVKLRLCSLCSVKLNYHTKKKEVKRLTNRKKKLRDKPIEEVSSTNKEEDGKVSDTKASTSEDKEDNIWSAPVMELEKSREDEIEEYLEELLF